MTKLPSVYHKLANFSHKDIKAERFSYSLTVVVSHPGAAEADRPLPEAELEPGVSGTEVPHRSPGQAPLPQDYQRTSELRRKMLLYKYECKLTLSSV